MRKSLCGLVFLVFVSCVRDMAEIRGADLQPVRGNGTGEWVQSGTTITNTETKDASGAGVGECLGRLSKAPGPDLVLRCSVAFERNAAGGVFFRGSIANGRLASGYLLRVRPQGVELWRFDGAMEVPLQQFARVLAAETPHGLRVAAQGDKIAVELDGEALFKVRDRMPLGGAEAGLYARGPCRFESISLEKP